MKRFKIIAAIADIHIGIRSISPESIKRQLKDNFFTPLKKIRYLDAVLVLGDILHTIVSLNSEYAETFNWFISKLYDIGKKRKCPIIIIKGTISHDNDQLNTIKHYQYDDDNVDFRIYDTVKEIDLFDNFHILVLPDVRIKDTKEIEKHLDKEYDMIIGHGLIDKMRFVVQESESSPTKTYVFDSEKLMSLSRGPVLFGHIHQFQHIKNKFYYVGPFTLLERGGHNAGFAIIGIDDVDHTKYKVEHFINPDSARYFDIDIDKSMIDQYDAKSLIEAIDDIIEDADDNDLITLRITRGSELEASEKVLMLESRYRPDKRISIIKKIKSNKDEELEKENKEKIKRYSYIEEKSFTMPEIIFRYYEEDIKPKFKDPHSDEATLTLDDFIEVFK